MRSERRFGWFKFHRQILSDPIICKDAQHLALFVWLLGAAAYDKSRQVVFNGVARTILPGELVTGRKELARELGISESKVERILSLFREYGIIEQETSTRGRLLRIVNWKMYQEGSFPPLPDEEEEVEPTSSTSNGNSGISTSPKKTSNPKSTTSPKGAKTVASAKANIHNSPISSATEQPFALRPELQTIIDHLKEGNRTTSPSGSLSQRQLLSPPTQSKEYKRTLHSSLQGSHPSIQEVKGFIEQEKLLVSAEVWYNYYASVGWKIGKRRMTGKSWQNSLKTWHWRETEKRKRENQNVSAYSVGGATYNSHREWLQARERASLRVNDYFDPAVRGFSPYENPEILYGE